MAKALDAIDDDWYALLAAAWASIGVTAGGWLYDDFDDSDAEEALLIAAIIAALKARAKGISDTTRARLIAALEADADAQAAISALYDLWTGGDDGDDAEGESRGDRIAWDLTIGAWAAGLQVAGRQAESNGLTATRTWVTMGDNRVRAAHVEADGQTIGMDDLYTVGGEELAYPGDPTGRDENVANCRCGENYDIS